MAKTTLYLVSSGERSDYDVEAAFSTRELAENAIVENHRDSKGWWRFNDDIEEIELDPADWMKE